MTARSSISVSDLHVTTAPDSAPATPIFSSDAARSFSPPTASISNSDPRLPSSATKSPASPSSKSSAYSTLLGRATLQVFVFVEPFSTPASPPARRSPNPSDSDTSPPSPCSARPAKTPMHDSPGSSCACPVPASAGSSSALNDAARRSNTAAGEPPRARLSANWRKQSSDKPSSSARPSAARSCESCFTMSSDLEPCFAA
mmetsp:Transcript_49283/g.129944  ORF Transcript_49283/g.129944 Transcript_49283/m.129944 type:complete len:201 (-) Transcript_49283:296-898(-)